MSRPLSLRKVLTALILATLALGIGLKLGWLDREPTEAEIRDLEASWQRVVELANEPELEPGVVEPLQELLDSWSRDGARPVDQRWNELRMLLTDRPDCTLDGSPQFPQLLEVTGAAIRSEALDGDGLVVLTRLAGHLCEHGDLLQFAVGAHLLRTALDRCRSEPLLAEILRGLAAPQLDEAFRAICRDALSVLSKSYPLTADETEPGYLFVRDATRQALADHILRLEPLRSDPSSWSSVQPPPQPGALALWWGLQIQDPEIMAAKIAPMVWLTPDGIAELWVGVVSDWNDLLQAGDGR